MLTKLSPISKIICIILLLLLIYVFVYFIVKKTCTKLEIFSFTPSSVTKETVHQYSEPFYPYINELNNQATNAMSEPHILIVASIHGNEPSGYEGMKQLIQDLQQSTIRLKRGSVTIIPTSNPCGKKLGLRWLPHQMMIFQNADGNRNYTRQLGEEARCEISRTLQNVAKGKTFVLDMHEGWGFHKVDPDSMGSGIYPGHSELSKQIASILTDKINSTIIQKPVGGTNPRKLREMQLDDFKFTTMDWPDTPGTYRWFCDLHKIPYILIETSGQGDIQPLQVRANQQYFLATELLRYFDMI